MPVYQLIGAEAAGMQDRGVTVAAIAGHFRVEDHTAGKAIRWYEAAALGGRGG